MTIINFNPPGSRQPMEATVCKMVPRETLFKWHSAAKLVAMYPGMRERIGSLNMAEVDAMVLDLEEVLGVVKGNPDFEGF